MNLLAINDETLVAKTTLTRKLTIGGVTKTYPVFRVSLELLFYNDQNDRIATWITQYKSEPSNPDFSQLDQEAYNKVIQNFIVESNPTALEKTKNNIAMVNQREPGVALSDGRIIDGNRRFTCLRLLHAEDPEFRFFETVILDAEGENTAKQIKMLELSIQHGEEQRVAYNLIDLTIGAYHDIVETKLLTINEYAESTNESLADVRKRLEIAELIIEFLDYIRLSRQYHVAREMQVYSVFYETVSLLKKCGSDEECRRLKYSVFDNLVTGAVIDQKRFIRSLKSMVESGVYGSYLKRQERLHADVENALSLHKIRSRADIAAFAKENSDLAEDLAVALDKSVTAMKTKQSRSKPSQMVAKSLSTLLDIDTGIVDILSDSERAMLTTQIRKLNRAAVQLAQDCGETLEQNDAVVQTKKVPQRILLAPAHPDEPFVYCLDEGKPITNLNFRLKFGAFRCNAQQKENANALVFFVNADHEQICPVQEISFNAGEQAEAFFSLNSGASGQKECYLVLKSANDSFQSAQRLIPFAIKIAFSVEFDF